MTGARLGIFALVLAAVVAGGLVLGAALDPDPGDGHADAGMDAAMDAPPHAAAEAPSDAPQEPRGLAVAAGGLRLVAERTELPARGAPPFRFRILGEDGRPVTDFEVEHERRMHVIAVRRDLSDYHHVHPRLAGDGTWEVDLGLEDPGSYRVFADFNRGGESYTLGIDVSLPGRYAPRGLPAPADEAEAAGGYRVRLAEQGGEVRFTVERDGHELEDLEPYLGARGHLVALREGDLAYLHVHPESEATEGRDIRFAVEYPSAGRYALFLQFKHEGRVRTAVFTRKAEEVRDAGGH